MKETEREKERETQREVYFFSNVYVHSIGVCLFVCLFLDFVVVLYGGVGGGVMVCYVYGSGEVHRKKQFGVWLPSGSL